MFWNLKKCPPLAFFSDRSSCREDFFSSSKDNKNPKGGNKPGAGITSSKTQGCGRHCSRYSRSSAGQVGAQFQKYYFSERCTKFEIYSHVCSMSVDTIPVTKTSLNVINASEVTHAPRTDKIMGKKVDEGKAGRALHPRARLQRRDVAKKKTPQKKLGLESLCLGRSQKWVRF